MISSGGQFSGGLTINGGIVSLVGSVGVGQTASFGGATGDLSIAAGGSFQGQISGFAPTDKLDLGGFAYAASESVTYASAPGGLSGTLTLTSAGASESLTLVGSYVVGNFKLLKDGKGGTIIEGVKAKAGATIALAQAMAGFTGGAGLGPQLAATSASIAPLLAAQR